MGKIKVKPPTPKYTARLRLMLILMMDRRRLGYRRQGPLLMSWDDGECEHRISVSSDEQITFTRRGPTIQKIMYGY